MPTPGLMLWVCVCACLLLVSSINCIDAEVPQLTEIPAMSADTPVIQVTAAAVETVPAATDTVAAAAEAATKPRVAATSTNTTAPVQVTPQIEVLQMQVNADDVDELMALHEEIDKQAGMAPAEANGPVAEMRTERELSERQRLKAAADALTDEEINEIVQMISFPPDQRDAITEDKEAYATHMHTDDAKPEQREGGDLEMPEMENEPRNTGTDDAAGGSLRAGRALQGGSRGYYILAFSPIEGPLVPISYTKLDIIPAERSLEGDMALRRATRKYANADADVRLDGIEDDDEDELLMAGSETDESRMLSMKILSKYIRRMMRQIRKGTRKIQRKTRFKTHASEPTVEKFLHKLYQQRQQQKKQQSSWYSW